MLLLSGRCGHQSQNYDEALKNFSKSAELAELYGDMTQMSKSNGWVAKIYQIQGGDAFNNKDDKTAAGIFEKGYKADPDNTAMALNLAMSYCEMGEYEKGMDIYEAIAAKTHPKYAEDVAKAKEMMALYTNNKVAEMQGAGDFDGIIAMADAQLAKNPASALFQNVRLQAYSGKKDYAKVIELGQAAADAQVDEEDKSLMYYLLGAAYNAKGDEGSGHRRLPEGDRRSGCRECQGCPCRTAEVIGPDQSEKNSLGHCAEAVLCPLERSNDTLVRYVRT